MSGNARVFQTSSVGWVLPDTNFAMTFALTKEPLKASASHNPPLAPRLVSVASPAAPNLYVSLMYSTYSSPKQPSCYY